MYGANVQEGRRDSTVECGVSMAGGASPGEGVRGWEGCARPASRREGRPPPPPGGGGGVPKVLTVKGGRPPPGPRGSAARGTPHAGGRPLLTHPWGRGFTRAVSCSFESL